MSISNLFYPNSYDTFSSSLNTNTLISETATVGTVNTTSINIVETNLPSTQIWESVNTTITQTLKHAYNGFQLIFYDSTTSNFTTSGTVNKIGLRISGNDQLAISTLGIKEPRGNNGIEYAQPVLMKLNNVDELCLFVVKKISSTVVELYYRRTNNANFVAGTSNNSIRSFTVSYPVAE